MSDANGWIAKDTGAIASTLAMPAAARAATPISTTSSQSQQKYRRELADLRPRVKRNVATYHDVMKADRTP